MIQTDSELRVNQFVINPSQDQIHDGRQSHKVEPKVMLVLLYLIQHKERVVSVEELLESVWAGTVVTPRSAQRCISILRNILKVDAGTTYIQTFSKKGYRWMIEPERSASSSAKPAVLNNRVKDWLIAAVLIGLIGAFFLSEPFKTPASEIERYTSEEQSVHHIAWHPGGRYSAWLKTSANGMEVTLQQGAEPGHVIYRFEESKDTVQLAWSHDGTKLAVQWQDEASKVVVVEFDEHTEQTGAPKQVWQKTDQKIRSVSFLDSENLLLTVSPQELHNHKLYRFNLATQSLSPFLPHQYARLAKSNGKLVAFVEVDNLQRHIYFYDPHAQKILHTHTTQDRIRSLTWLPDGSGIIYVTGSNRLLRLNVTGELTPLPIKLRGKIASLAIGGEPEMLYWSRHDPNWDLWLKPESECCVKPYVQSSADETQGAFEPKGRALAYVSTRTGEQQIWLKSAQAERQLTQFTQAKKIKHLSWSQDGAWLAFQADSDVYVLSLSLSQSAAVITHESFVTPLGLSADGRMLYYTDRNSVELSLWQLEISSQKKQQLLPRVEQAMVLHGEIFYSVPYQDKVYRYNRPEPVLVGEGFPVPFELIGGSGSMLYYRHLMTNKRQTVWGYTPALQQHQEVLNRTSYRGKVTTASETGDLLIELSQGDPRAVFRWPLRLDSEK